MADVNLNSTGVINDSGLTREGYLLLIAGQSNSVDRFTMTGNIAAGLQSTMTDCYTYFKTTYTASNDGSWVQMRTGVNTQAGTPQTNMFSLGLIIANKLNTTYSKSAYIIPTGVAGTFIANDVNPSWNSTHTSQYYDNMIGWFFRKAYPSVNMVNLTPVFLWVHGESDTDTVQHGIDYEANLTALIAKMRLDTGFPDMKVIITKLRSDYGGGTPLGLSQVRTSQVNVVANVANCYMYDTETSDTHLSSDTYHYNPISASFGGTQSATNLGNGLADLIATF